MTTAIDPAALWASAQVTALAEGVQNWTVPAYGSPQWLQLPAGDPRKAAALVEAAEQWRRHVAERARLDNLLTADPEGWYREVTREANEYARTVARQLVEQPTHAEVVARRARHAPAHQLKATPGWPPIAVPGQPGRYLTAREAA